MNPTYDEAAFTREVVSFLDDRVPKRETSATSDWGAGDDDVSLYDDLRSEHNLSAVQSARDWRATRFDNGLGWLTGPRDLGGRGLPRSSERVYESLERRYAVPPVHLLETSVGIVAPTIQAVASEELQKRYLAAIHRGDVVAQQLFSEPGAGSDLASLRCRAERDGDSWVLSGQKVWTSGAQFADIGEILCRTDPTVPKHAGLTAFLVDLRAPGVEVRPLRQMTGSHCFNEVFFDDVVVPSDHVLGEVGKGWDVALTTLRFERAAVGGNGRSKGIGNGVRLIALIKHLELDKDPTFRDELARVITGFQVARWTSQRAMAGVRAGQSPGAALSGAKLALTQNLQAVSELVSRALGARLIADTGEWGTFAWTKFVLGVPGSRIAGGTDEIQRNTIAERVLDLPREPWSDRTIPFNELPSSG